MMVPAGESSFLQMNGGWRVGWGRRGWVGGLSCSWAVSMFSFCVFEVACHFIVSILLIKIYLFVLHEHLSMLSMPSVNQNMNKHTR